MKNFLFFCILMGCFSVSTYSQTYTSITKHCGKCGKEVSSSAKVGDKCPYCGVIWGSESSQTTTTTKTPYLYNPYATNSTSDKKSNNSSEVEVDDSKASKTETEEWILSKLKKYTPSNYFYTLGSGIGWHLSDFKFYFTNYYLVIEYYSQTNQKEILYGKPLPQDTIKVEIPMYDFDKAYRYNTFKDGEHLWITTKSATIIETTNSKTKKVTTSFSTQFNLDAETDLCERLHKAFFHLKKFYKKPVSNEPF